MHPCLEYANPTWGPITYITRKNRVEAKAIKMVTTFTSNRYVNGANYICSYIPFKC